MKTGREVGIASLIIWIIIHFISREYCLCCTRSCCILTMNVWDYLYIVSILGGIFSLLLILGLDLEKQDEDLNGNG